ncbi:MAG: EAL domain-containing protein [Armatimonadota bacterium]|nr:EAL domain-containing protein [bacterium]
MTGISHGQTDYILFLSGISFGILAVACLIPARMRDERLPWTLLGAACVARAVDEWMSMVAFCIGDTSLFASLRLVVVALAYLLLLAFARRGTIAVCGKGPGVWVMFLLIGCAAAAGLVFKHDYLLSIRYTLGLVGWAWTALVLYLESGRSDLRSRRFLAFSSVLQVIYALMLVVSRGWFYDVTGVSIFVVRSILIILSGSAVWAYFHFAFYEKKQGVPVPWFILMAPLSLLVAVGVGYVVTNQARMETDRRMRSDLLFRTMMIADSFPPTKLQGLLGSAKDTSTNAYKRLKLRLEDILDKNPSYGYAYLMGIRRGKVVFLVDGEPADSEDFSPPGSVYDEEASKVEVCLSGGQAYVEGPLADEWGSWVSGLAPVRNGDSGATVGVLGLDIASSDWEREISRARLLRIFFTLFVCVILLTVIVILQSAHEFTESLVASEKRYRDLFEKASDIVFTIDSQGRMLSKNRAVEVLTGYAADEMPCIFDLVAPEYMSLMRNLVWRRVSGENVSVGQQIGIVRKDGSRATIEVTSQVPSRSGGDVRIHCIARDITERKTAEEALRRSEEKYHLIFDRSPLGVLHFDEHGTITDCNDNIAIIVDNAKSKIIGFNMLNKAGLSAAVTEALDGKTGYYEGDYVTTMSCKTITLRAVFGGIISNDGEFLGGVGILEDVTEHKRARKLVKIQSSAIDAAGDQIVITDSQARIEFVNNSFLRETGYTAEEVMGQNPRILSSGKHSSDFYADMWRTVLSGNTWQGEIVNRRKDGALCTEDMSITPVKNDSGVIEHFIAIKRNITDKKLYEQQLNYLAHHDPLTGLPNRLLFSDRLTQALAQARREKTMLAVMFVDLDRFKVINDTLGHSMGDILLKQVADRLAGCLRDSDTLARMGGDEFMIILRDVDSVDDADVVARRIQEALSEPVELGGQDYFATASMGISIFPADGSDVETLVKNADTAMYRAKAQGRNNFQLYTQVLDAAALERITVETNLRRALERDEFRVYYQPLVDIRTGSIKGVEALLRWQSADFGLVQPSDFIPLAEETGLIVPISEWVLHEACAQNKAWQDAGLARLDVAVNISPSQLQHHDLVAAVKHALDESGLDPSYLDLELTESTLMAEPDLAEQMLSKLKSMGIRISIDDFGTGYSSLSYLKRFTVDTVKIDRSFIREITTNPDDAAIARAVIAIARALKLRVVAEGVETLEQLEFLRTLQCDEMQGYFVSPPIPADDLTILLQRSNLRPGSDIERAA